MDNEPSNEPEGPEARILDFNLGKTLHNEARRLYGTLCVLHAKTVLRERGADKDLENFVQDFEDTYQYFGDRFLNIFARQPGVFDKVYAITLYDPLLFHWAELHYPQHPYVAFGRARNESRSR